MPGRLEAAPCPVPSVLSTPRNILDRTLTTLDENPELVKGLLETAGSAVDSTGEIGQQATKPGGGLSELSSGVGDTLGNIGSSVGDTASSIAGKANPKQLTSGSGSKKSNRGSNGSNLTKGAAAAGHGRAPAPISRSARVGAPAASTASGPRT